MKNRVDREKQPELDGFMASDTLTVMPCHPREACPRMAVSGSGGETGHQDFTVANWIPAFAGMTARGMTGRSCDSSFGHPRPRHFPVRYAPFRHSRESGNPLHVNQSFVAALRRLAALEQVEQTLEDNGRGKKK